AEELSAESQAKLGHELEAVGPRDVPAVDAGHCLVDDQWAEVPRRRSTRVGAEPAERVDEADPALASIRRDRSIRRTLNARRLGHRYHFPHSPFELQERGMHRGLTKGTTAQPSRLAMRRIGGIHICAWESPITTIVFELGASPSRQILLDVFPSPGEQPAG